MDARLLEGGAVLAAVKAQTPRELASLRKTRLSEPYHCKIKEFQAVLGCVSSARPVLFERLRQKGLPVTHFDGPASVWCPGGTR